MDGVRTRDPHPGLEVGPARRPACGRRPERLLVVRERYVGSLGAPPVLWRVTASGHRALGGPPPSAGDAAAVRRWAARGLLAAAVRRRVPAAAVHALAADLPGLVRADDAVALTDLEVRLWYLAWRLGR